MRRALLPFALATACVLAFLLMGQAPSPHGAMELYSPGGGLATAAADAAYLRLDATNDPVTGDVYFGSPAGNSHLLDGATANLWTSVLDSDATGNFAAHGVTAWNGATWDAGAILSAFGEGYPGNGYCTSVADAPGSAELWLGGDATSQSRLCGSVTTGVELGVSSSDGTSFENVIGLTGTGAVVNDDGAADLDFRVEGDTNANLIYCDSGSDSCGVGTATNIDGTNRLTASVNDSTTAIDSVNAAFASRNENTTNNTFAMIGLQSLTTSGVTWGVARILGRAVNHTAASINGDLIFQARAGSGSSWSEPLAIIGATSRVGVGTLTPSTRFEVNGQAAAAVGSASAPSWSFAGDLNTGFYRSAADSISWSVGGAEGGVLRTTEANFYLPVSVDSGTAADPSLRFSSDVDTGLYRDTANTVRVSGGGVRAASIAPGAFTVYDTDGTTILMGAQTGSGFVGSGIDFAPSADNTSDLGYASFRWNQVHAEKVQNGASTAGSSPLELNDDTTCPADTSGTVHTFRLPTGMATTHLTRPTCDSSHAGMLIFVDDTDDGDPGEVCVCTDNGTYPGPTWAWWFIDHTKACDT